MTARTQHQYMDFEGVIRTYIKKKGIFANSLNRLDEESWQLAFYVDQVVQWLFGNIWVSIGNSREEINSKMTEDQIRVVRTTNQTCVEDPTMSTKREGVVHQCLP